MIAYLVFVFCLSWFAEVWLRVARHATYMCTTITQICLSVWHVFALPFEAIKSCSQTYRLSCEKCKRNCLMHHKRYMDRLSQDVEDVIYNID